MKTDEIRKKFLDFFASKGHKVIPSDTLVPQNDPSVLFTSAGMNQFKEQFMGNLTGFTRATSCQKCLRTGDLVNVGKSPTHHTFFEMLGNFSFGDYFKKDAITWAWEFVTQELKLPSERLWVSVHQSDDEAYAIWANEIKIPQNRIVRLGDKDNFWPANAPKDGPNGPCGPCSEIFYDWGEETGCRQPECSPACDCKRFFEIWNLVFTQYNRQSDGKLLPLPSRNIDTGMGLERAASVMQKVRSNYGTDLFLPIIGALENLLKRSEICPAKEWMEIPAKAVSDHIRAAVFAIADGVVPSNESRGYVIRKLIRRSIMYLKQTGINQPLCYQLVYPIAKVMENSYPEIKRRHETIAGIIKKDEELFWKVLNEKTPLAEQMFKGSNFRGPWASGTADNALETVPEPNINTGSSPAHKAFVLYDTYGIPLEVSKEIAQKFNLVVSEDEFEKLMEEQRERSRSGTQISGEIFGKSMGIHVGDLESIFTGYSEKKTTKAKVIALLQDGPRLTEVSSGSVKVILDKTPFYVESGGQTGDKGKIFLKDSGYLEVVKVEKVNNAILHMGTLNHGLIRVGDEVTVEVVEPDRLATEKNHTATHLLQYALRTVLGEHVEQSGSFVSPERLRFDFSHLKALPRETLEKIELQVNQLIWENVPVTPKLMSLDEAKKTGALAFFGEKYGTTVRVLNIGDYSREFCGGTHVRATGEIGLFKIISESSVAQGVRRIEAVTGPEALKRVQKQEDLLLDSSALLKTVPEKFPESLEKLLTELKQKEKDLKKLKTGSVSGVADSLIAQTQQIAGVNCVISDMGDYDMESLRHLSDTLRAKKDPIVCVLAASGEKNILLTSISASLVQKGLDAVKIIKEITAVIGGGGGGKKEMAQAGAKDAAGLKQCLDKSREIIENHLNNLR